MLQRIDLCKFQPKLTPLYLWPPLGGIHEQKWGKVKKCLQPTRNTHVAKDSRVV